MLEILNYRFTFVLKAARLVGLRIGSPINFPRKVLAERTPFFRISISFAKDILVWGMLKMPLSVSVLI
jgi:hypothetical protein